MSFFNLGTIFLSSVFILSALFKYKDMDGFHKTLIALGIRSKTIAIVFISLELFIGVALTVDRFNKYGEYGSIILLLIFAIITISTMLKKQNIKCNCFGNLIQERFGYATLIRIFILFNLNIIIIIDQNRNINNMAVADLLYSVLFSVGIIMIYAMLSIMIDMVRERNKSLNVRDRG